jgi:hypothetical protein
MPPRAKTARTISKKKPTSNKKPTREGAPRSIGSAADIPARMNPVTRKKLIEMLAAGPQKCHCLRAALIYRDADWHCAGCSVILGRCHCADLGDQGEGEVVNDAVQVASRWSRMVTALTPGEYKPNKTGHHETLIREYGAVDEYRRDAVRLTRAGWTPVLQSQDGGHVNVGRSVTGAALTGGLSLLFGGSRTRGKIIVTWTRNPE